MGKRLGLCFWITLTLNRRKTVVQSRAYNIERAGYERPGNHFVVEESPEGGYEARALGYSIFTQGESLEELRKMVCDAVACHFDGPERPSLIRLHLVKDEVIPA